MRSTYGAVAGSTLEDWPIAYADLEPYYEKAEWEMGVSGDDSNNIFEAPRRKPLPMPPLPPNQEYQMLHPAAQRLGLHPFDIPMLRNSVPYNGRRGCMRCRWCVGFACEVNARTGTHNTVIPTALATGNCELRTGCMTREILLDDRGRATGVAYFDSARPAPATDRRPGNRVRRRHRIGAPAAEHQAPAVSQRPGKPLRLGGPQPAGSLLLRRDRPVRFRYLRRPWAGRFHRHLRLQSRQPGTGRRRHAGQRVHPPAIPVHGIRFRHGSPRWGQEHKEFVRTAFKRTIVVMGPVQEMPLFDSRVQVDPKVKDYWGIPVARLSGGQASAHHSKSRSFMAGKARGVAARRRARYRPGSAYPASR